jgi:subtilisin-like proprotein convertase family protein
MKKIIFIFILFFVCSDCVFSQIIYNPKIDSIINLVTLSNITKYAKELTGDTITLIGGLPFRIYSRYNLSPSKVKASQYIFEKFQNFGLNTRYMIVDSNCKHIIATKTGNKYPNQYFIICAHYDAILIPIPTPLDTVPGADDNASGVCAVLETARLLSNFSSPYSLIFIAFDREELSPPGSLAYVDSIYNRGDTIRGVLNLDMIAYDGNNDSKCYIFSDTNSTILANQLINAVLVYQLGLQTSIWPFPFGGDHSSFWSKNYRAIGYCEDAIDDFNPQYHKKNDKVNLFNLNYFYKMIKSSIAIFSSWGSGYFVRIDHKPLPSFYDTTGRFTEAYINYATSLGTGINAPRLYYKVWNGSYNYVNPYSVYLNNYKFYIPGQPRGSKISYYIAAQDSAGTFVFTLPTGGSGINPPGTTPPAQQFIYYVWTNKIVNSNTVPKPITGLLTQDTIHIQTGGTVIDVDVNLNLNHTNDGDLLISLAKLSTTSTLSQYNGVGGQNFTNTIFDDSASLSIIQGNPPFTGRFRPQTPLSPFRNTELSGDWILRIFDKGTGNTGTLLNWGIYVIYAPSVSIKEISKTIPESFSLFQNYPNPFNPTTKIRFEIPDRSPIGTFGDDNVVLKIYDILGREIQKLVNEKLKPGSYEVTFDGSNLPSGIYFYRLHAGDFADTKRMTLIK